VGALPVDHALIDGEAVVFLPDGHSDFAALLTKAGGE
jgi:ATP-dependent DNA ligase